MTQIILINIRHTNGLAEDKSRKTGFLIYDLHMPRFLPFGDPIRILVDIFPLSNTRSYAAYLAAGAYYLNYLP